MRLWMLGLSVASVLCAGDEPQLALSLRAQGDFDKVQLSAAPVLADTYACIQSQAALLPVAPRTDLPLIHYRKGYCTLMGATVSRQSSQFALAAAEFDAAAQTWPARVERAPKGIAVEPVPSAVPVLAAIARLESGADPQGREAAGKAIRAALAQPFCPGAVMSAAVCRSIDEIGRRWVGWLALGDNRLDEAARAFSAGGWPEWVAGRRAFEGHQYGAAAQRYQQAIAEWQRLASLPAPSLAERLAPRPDMARSFADLGGAELLAGHAAEAITALTNSIQRDPERAWTYYLRARAKDAAGQSGAALADYGMASRTAFAGPPELGSGEAHLYRGILLYRRKDFVRAEEEFSSALNLEIEARLRPDAVAWRHLAAVAAGACAASREQLQRALPAASPYFPSREAEGLIAACMATREGALP